ncbi:PLDc N-terminal domain-containing protein [Arthrobacter flavus]|uniref:PLDc N-terminal domain-containing protein n=1 Tax=Arthrobacter flavus TaxID=95172 RepID=A0ABW4Q6W9_9MICC
MTNPLVPGAWDVMFLVLALTFIVLTMLAIISIVTRRQVSVVMKVLWVTFVIYAPFLGPAIWCICSLGRTSPRGLVQPRSMNLVPSKVSTTR